MHTIALNETSMLWYYMHRYVLPCCVLCFKANRRKHECRIYFQTRSWHSVPLCVRCNTDACAVPCLLPQTGVSADLCAEILVDIALKLALLPFF